jgi:hypothetical protein
LDEPDRLILEVHVDFNLAVFGFTDMELALSGIGPVKGYHVFAPERTASFSIT